MPVLRFKRTLLADTDVVTLWTEFENAFLDSLEARIWPNNLVVIRSEGLVAGNKVLAEYYGPFGTSAKRFYKIIEVQPRLFFCYAPFQPHSFSGEARVDFEAVSERKTRVIWSGEYHFKGIPLAYLYFKLYFEKHFFDALQKSLSEFLSAPRRGSALNA